MKKLLILSLFLTSQFSLGKTPESELQKLKPDADEDYVVIYQELRAVDPEIKKMNDDTRFLRTTFNIYDNIELKGEPVYVVTPDIIKVGKEHYKISDSFIGSCDPVCDKYKFIPIDFVRVYFNSLALAVKEYKNEIARVEHKNKNYYFKFKLDDTSKIYEWRSYTKIENIKKILEKDLGYIAFVEEIKKCVKSKNLKCLEPFLDDMYLTIEKVEKEARKRGVYDDEKLCKEFEMIRSTSSRSIGVDDVPDNLLEKIKSIDFIWEKIGYSLDLSNKTNSKMLIVKSFGESLQYVTSKELEHPSICFEQSRDIYLELFLKKNQKWKIIGLGFNAITR